LIEEMGAFVSDYQICLTDAEVKYYEAMKELEKLTVMPSMNLDL
jgi:hypothetical protein